MSAPGKVDRDRENVLEAVGEHDLESEILWYLYRIFLLLAQ